MLPRGRHQPGQAPGQRERISSNSCCVVQVGRRMNPNLLLIDELELGVRERRPGGVAHELGATGSIVGANSNGALTSK